MITSGQPVAVTGATGFIGSHLCAELQARGYQVRALVRDVARAGDLADLGVELVEGDLTRAEPMERLVEGSAAVVHAAGAVRGASQRTFDAVNVDGTAAVVEAAKRLPAPPRLLFVSSLAAREPALSWYARSKRTAEELLERESGLDWIIVRPPAVYGPGDREMLPVLRLMARGLALVPGSAQARLSLVHVSDLVAALVASLESTATRSQIYSLCDGRAGGYDWRELGAIVESVTGRRVRLWQVPAPLLNTVAQINLLRASVTGGAPMLTPAKLRELRHPDWVVDNRTIYALTGWEPSIDLHHGLRALLGQGALEN